MIDSPRSPTQLNAELQSHLPQFLDIESTWYRRWYFELRLEEEMLRCSRYDRELAVIVLRLENIGPKLSDERADFDQLLGRVADEHLRATDIPGLLDDGEYAILLPETDLDGAEILADRLRTKLAAHLGSCRIALFPRDGATKEELLRNDSDVEAAPIDISLYRRAGPRV